MTRRGLETWLVWTSMVGLSLLFWFLVWAVVTSWL